MRLHLFGHHPTATNGAPQTVAVGFVSLIFFTLLLPFAKVSIGDAMAPEALIQLLRTGTTVNVFALFVLLAPLIGVGVALLARSTWRISTMLVALAAFIMIPLALNRFDHALSTATQGLEIGVPGLASYILMFGYGVLITVTGITAFRAR